jgi:NADPH:quinone reductase-like Zn-dependent oxidoreductase
MVMTREIELPGIGDTLRIRTRDLPEPGPGQALVRVEATGVSFAEQQMRLGKYYDQPPFPFVPGYDLVGTVESGPRRGERVAALTKTGAWADRVLLDEGDLVPVPEGVSPEQAETVIVNGLTAYRMLFRSAKVERGDTVLVLGATGGVGSILVALARHAGVRVIGTTGPKQLGRLRAAGAEAIDYRAEDVPARVRELAPDGVAAVFDHVGGPGIADSWKLLARGGTLVSYGTASTKDEPGSSRLPVLKLIARLTLWNALPNGRRATFFNLWAGARRRERFQARLREDLGTVLGLVARGEIATEIAARFPLSQAPDALAFAEQGGHAGKVVIVAD